MSGERIETTAVAQMVESYVDRELLDAEKYDNRAPFDESGVFDLHTLAARVYAEGYRDGANTEQLRSSGAVRRQREKETNK